MHPPLQGVVSLGPDESPVTPVRYRLPPEHQVPPHPAQPQGLSARRGHRKERGEVDDVALPSQQDVRVHPPDGSLEFVDEALGLSPGAHGNAYRSQLSGASAITQISQGGEPDLSTGGSLPVGVATINRERCPADGWRLPLLLAALQGLYPSIRDPNPAHRAYPHVEQEPLSGFGVHGEDLEVLPLPQGQYEVRHPGQHPRPGDLYCEDLRLVRGFVAYQPLFEAR